MIRGYGARRLLVRGTDNERPDNAMNTKRNPFSLQLDILTLLLLLFAILPGAGCAKLDPGADAVVVRAEQSAALGAESLDAFVQYEYRNRAALWAIDHGFKGAADSIRERGPAALQTLRDATKAYKASRTPEGKASLYTALAVVEALIADANLWTGKGAARGIQ